MWEIILATVLSFSAGIRAPRIENVPFDYELSYQIENRSDNVDFLFKHDYERENGFYFNDLRAKFNLNKSITLFGADPLNHKIILKEDFKQIQSKNLYQFNSDIRYQYKIVSLGYAYVDDLQGNRKFAPSIGIMKNIKKDKWELNTDNDLYVTNPMTYQADLQLTYNITNRIGVGFLGNYIQTIDNNDYAAKAIVTIKLGEAK